MSSDNVTPIRPAGPESSPPDQFDRIYDGIQAHLDALRCVHGVLAASGEIDQDEALSAARGLLHRTFRELDRLHSDLAQWHMAQSKVQS
jgi:hypothetical protein